MCVSVLFCIFFARLQTANSVAHNRSSAVRLLVVAASLILLADFREMAVHDHPHVHVNRWER